MEGGVGEGGRGGELYVDYILIRRTDRGFCIDEYEPICWLYSLDRVVFVFANADRSVKESTTFKHSHRENFLRLSVAKQTLT